MAKSITVRQLLVKLGIEADQKALDKFDAGLEDVKTGMGKVAKGGAQLAGILGIVTGALLGVTLATVAAGDAAAKGGARVGVTAEEYQELAVAAEKSAASVEDLEAALKDQALRAGVARAGSKEQAAAFRKFAGGLDDANGKAKTQIQLFQDAADGISKLTTEQQQLDAANRLFGESGVKLIPLLKLGSAGIKELRKQARATGEILSNKAAAQAEVFNDSLTDLKGIALGVRNTIGVALLPMVTKLAEGLRDWFLANQKIINQRVEVWALRVSKAFATIGPVLKSMDRLVRNTIGTWAPIVIGVGLALAGLILAVPVVTILSGAIITLAGAIAILEAVAAPIAVFFGVPLVLVLAGAALAFLNIAAVLAVFVVGITAVFLALDEMIVLVRGGKTVFGSFTETLRSMGGVWVDIADAMEAVVRSTGESLVAFETLAGIVLVLVTKGLPMLFKWLTKNTEAFDESITKMREMNPVIDAILKGLGKLDEIRFENFQRQLKLVLGLVRSIFTFVGSGAANFNKAFAGAKSLEDIAARTDTFGALNAQASGDLSAGIKSALGFAPSSSSSRGGDTQTTTVIQQTNQITIPDAGSPEATAAAIVAENERALRAARDAFAGGEL